MEITNDGEPCILNGGERQEHVLHLLRTQLNTLVSDFEWHKGHSDALWKVKQLIDDIQTRRSAKPLIILDLNGVLIDREYNKEANPEEGVNEKVGNFLVWKRPALDGFLQGLFERYHVAVWSSVKAWNLDQLVKYIFNDKAFHHEDLAFCWSQDQCDQEEHPDEELRDKKPLFVKDLSKVWEAFPQFDCENTVIIDDTPEKIRATKLSTSSTSTYHHIEAVTWLEHDNEDEYLYDDDG